MNVEEKYLNEDFYRKRPTDSRKTDDVIKSREVIMQDSTESKKIGYEYSKFCGNCKHSKQSGPDVICKNRVVMDLIFPQQEDIWVEKLCVCKYHKRY